MSRPTSAHGPNLCVGCRFLHRDDRLDTLDLSSASDTRTCTAFPTGIPADILDGSVDHRQPFLGDHGIQYVEQVVGTARSYDEAHRLSRRLRKV